MSWIRHLLLWTGAAILLLAAVAYLLPRHVHVERSIAVAAPRAAVFAQVDGYRTFNTWSPWFELDPNAKYTFEGPATGVGAKLSWVGDSLGSGSQIITASRADSRVDADVDFGQGGIAKQVFTLADTGTGTGTKVTWGMDVDLGMNPVSRYFGLSFDAMIGRDFDKGLANLKRVVEAAR